MIIYSFRPQLAPRVQGGALELEIATCSEVSHSEVLTGVGQWEIGTEGGGGRCYLEKKLYL